MLTERVDEDQNDDRPEGDDAGRGSDDLAARLTRRREQISERIEQLHERERSLAERRRGGSSPQDAARAQEHAEQAHVHAREAHENAGRRHDEAAAAHLHTADVLDRHGAGDRAREHREAAGADRADAGSEREAARQEE